jgi:hypothetical protein
MHSITRAFEIFDDILLNLDIKMMSSKISNALVMECIARMREGAKKRNFV